MILEFSDWLLFADVDSTRAYAEDEVANHCTCAYCQNYYRVIDKTYPNLRYFLSRFGVNIEAPESLIPITAELYQATYAAQGKILRKGSEPIWIHDVAVTLEEDGEENWFSIHLGIMKLPWVLEGDPKTIPSPYGLSEMLSDIIK